MFVCWDDNILSSFFQYVWERGGVIMHTEPYGACIFALSKRRDSNCVGFDVIESMNGCNPAKTLLGFAIDKRDALLVIPQSAGAL